MDTPGNKFAIPFRDMAERVERTLESEFAGAMLFVPPTGDPIAIMLTDPSQDKEALFAIAISKLQIAATPAQQQDTFGRPRR